ncbi:unnamed protein product [Cyprideis torosa]|uniref:Uncharacterized protein n=1 Tax=Cyprideis torosa TaxID=163714 RepID=A0A7R8ZLV1_9CRUS|nr:unnamed protein product [Cyprideis torosa]CAG0894123.1 unnamed protein product [Cyprideis torosa]
MLEMYFPSAASEGAFLLLSQHARRHGEFTYWSPHELQLPSYVVEAQSPHVVPLLPQQSDSLSVEATGYALMVHVVRQELFTNTIVRWLTVMRHSQAGWGSTRDSIVAFKALIDYSVQSRLTREITDLTVAVEASPLRGLVKNFFVNRDNMALTQKLGIPNAYGQVKLQGNGAGVALAQLALRYHVDRDEFLTPSPVPDAFQVETHMTLSGRNSSLMELKSCQRWLRGRQTGISSRVVLELPVPSGYEILESKLRHYIRHSGIENLNHAQVLPGKIAFFFSYLKTDDTCINLSLSRRYPVANMTRYLPVRLYHFDAPEEYVEKIIDAIRLYSLDICQVCGSYQCPYCPIYSSGPLLQTGYISVLVVGAFAFFSRVSFINVM